MYLESQEELRTAYHKPRYIPALGCDGLDSHDIADALGVRHDNVLRKIKNIDVTSWKAVGWNLTTGGVKLGVVGRPRIMAFFNTAAAKVFVARWENEKGNGYLNFLFDCERVATNELPRLRAQLKALQAADTRRLPRASTVDIAVGYYIQRSLFGDEVVTPRLTKIDKMKLDPREQRKAKSQHLTRIIEGVSNAKLKLENQELIDGLSPMCRPRN